MSDMDRIYAGCPITRMNAAKARRPASGGKTYKRAAARKTLKADRDWRVEGWRSWQFVRDQAIEQFRFDAFLDQFADIRDATGWVCL